MRKLFLKLMAISLCALLAISFCPKPSLAAIPSIPTGLSATSVSSGQINLSWHYNSDAAYYYIYRSTSYYDSYSIIGYQSANSYTDTGLASGTTYYYRIQAFNNEGSSSLSSPVYAMTTDYSNYLSATASGTNQINLAWNHYSGASYYYVTRSTSYSGSYSIVTTTTASSYTDTSLSQGTTYYYRIQAMNSSGSTIYYSDIASATSNSGNSNLTAAATSQSQIYLSWPSVSEAANYYISRSSSYAGTYSYITSTSSTAYTDSSLTSGTAYYYKVQAVRANGSSLYTFSPSGATTYTAGTPSQITSDRLAGNDRYETSSKISQSGWVNSYYAVVVSGENYPDALCSAPLAAKYKAPILLTAKNSLDTDTRAELQRLNVKRVFLIGGTGVISSAAEQGIRSMGIDVTRIAGTDRFDTSLKIAQFLGTSTEAVLVNGNSFADALSIAAIAGVKKMPILLTYSNVLPGSLKQYLRDNSIQTTYVIGGTGAITNGVMNQLPSPQRISGRDRYDTNLNIVSYFSSQLILANTYLATGESFPDALAGSALAALKKGPIVLVSNPLSSNTISFIRDRIGTNNQLVAFGGTGVVPESVFTNITGGNSLSRPDTPTSLTASSANTGQIHLSWRPVSTARNYYIYRSSSYYGNYTYLASTNSTNYTDSGLASNTTYYYKIAALNSAGSSNYSPIASASTITYPGTPSALTATPLSGSKIYLSWNSSSSAANYHIYRATSYYGSYSFLASTDNTYFTDTSLVNNTTYYYKIRAVNSLGTSDYSSIASAKTSNNYPSTPTGLSASASSTSQITLSWNSASYASSYYIYRSTSASGTYSSVSSTASTTFTDTSLSSGTTYYYKIRANNSLGYSDYTSYVSATTPTGTIPAVPAGLTATPVEEAAQIKLNWTAVSGATSYTVARAVTPGGPYGFTASAADNIFTDTGLSPNTSYFYKVLATNAAGSSVYSSEVQTLTVPAMPAVTVSVSGTTITLNWLSVVGAEKYNIFESSPTDSSYTYLANVDKSMLTMTRSGLEGTSYYYKVQAVNSHNKNGIFSVPVSATTIPVKPVNLTATASGANQITLTWDDAAGAATYTILRDDGLGGSYAEVATGLADNTPYVDTGLDAGKTYNYIVRAVNAAGNADSDAVSATAT